MWIVYAMASSLFAGITSILAKCGIIKTDSTVATAIRTIVVLLFSWIMVILTQSWQPIQEITFSTLFFLILSGLATGASWLCYFKALQNGDINKVIPIDKASTVLTIVLAIIFLGESFSMQKGLSILLIGMGTFLMIVKKTTVANQEKQSNHWLVYAILSAVFASATAILGKIGIQGINSNLGTAIRTTVVLVMAWMMVFATNKQHTIKHIEKTEMTCIILSGFATGASWLCYYKALQEGIVSGVVAIDKLSIMFTILFSWLVFQEKLSKKSFFGLLCIIIGTLLLALF